jgi:hypothetical protein
VVFFQSLRQVQSFQQTLQHNLSTALISSGLDTEGNRSTRLVPYRPQDATGVVYRYAIALSLSPGSGWSPFNVARVLVASLPDDFNHSQWRVEVLPSGWIEFALSDRAIALWLQDILCAAWSWRGEVELTPNPETLATDQSPRQASVVHLGGNGIRDGKIGGVQYAHARCCSLLRLGHREGLIELDGSQDKSPPWQWLHPHPVPWSIPPAKSAPDAARLSFNRPEEERLIGRVSEAVDALLGALEGDRLKVALRMSEAFLEFERDCRIWGRVKIDAPELAIARLGLVAVTQIVCAQLLQQLGVERLIEL